MAVVYKAEDVRLHRFVALKFLPDDFARDPSVEASGSGSGQRVAGENLARSRRRSGTSEGAPAYKDFLTLWKDADPDIPILNTSQS